MPSPFLLNTFKQMKIPDTLDFFQIEFYRIYRICRRLLLVILIFKATKNTFLQNLKIL